MQQLTILGATGSIGLNTLQVVREHAGRFEVFALSADKSVDKMLELVAEFKPKIAVMSDPLAAEKLRQGLRGTATEVLSGAEALVEVAQAPEADTVVAAIVGAAGLQSTLAAVCQGKRVLLANKESLVMAGGLFMEAVARHEACLLPVDSEHNAMFQCLPAVPTGGLAAAGVRKLILTGSGGPFRQTPLEALHSVTPEQACSHPNWVMGRKISVDSATMMNKGLEFIEACWLFGATPAQVQIVIHPQSIVHSMVEYIDGSVLAQLGQPDMRTPIAHCLGWPERIQTSVKSLNFWEMGALEFSAPDGQRFPMLRLASEAMAAGGTCPALLNAANEVAVEAFLRGGIRFTDISNIVDYVLQKAESYEPHALVDVLEADAKARVLASQWVCDFGSSEPARARTLVSGSTSPGSK